jgi:hypothetical protein
MADFHGGSVRHVVVDDGHYLLNVFVRLGIPVSECRFAAAEEKWADRVGSFADDKRATIVVKVPDAEHPWEQ